MLSCLLSYLSFDMLHDVLLTLSSNSERERCSPVWHWIISWKIWHVLLLLSHWLEPLWNPVVNLHVQALWTRKHRIRCLQNWTLECWMSFLGWWLARTTYINLFHWLFSLPAAIEPFSFEFWCSSPCVCLQLFWYFVFLKLCGCERDLGSMHYPLR